MIAAYQNSADGADDVAIAEAGDMEAGEEESAESDGEVDEWGSETSPNCPKTCEQHFHFNDIWCCSNPTLAFLSSHRCYVSSLIS